MLKGSHHSPETLLKIGISSKGRVHSEESKIKVGNSIRALKMIPWNKGKRGVYKHSIEVLERMRKNHPKGMLGKHHSEESRKKISNNNARIWKGKKLSIETRMKIGLAQIGNKKHFGHHHSDESKKLIGEKGKGRKKSEEQKKNISERMKGNKYGVGRFGELHPNWISDRTKLKKAEDRRTTAYFEWCKNVYKRDGWKCKISNHDCKGRIEAHHILSWRNYPELRYEVNNGITLCHFHHPNWRKDEKLSPYFQELVASSEIK